MLHVNFIQVKDSEDMGRAAADEFEAVIQAKPSCVIGLATGSTPIPLYRELILRERAGRIDFSRVRSVNLDEYKGLSGDNDQSYRYFMNQNLFDHVNIDKERTFVPDGLEDKGLAPDHPQSYRRFMQEKLFDHINIKPENTIVPDGLAEDIPTMCEQYERKLEDWGGIDIQLLGLGHDGHIGFNEPCDHFPAATHEVRLTEMTREANKRFFASVNNVPASAITMGVGTIMSAKKIVMLVTGKDKADILFRTFWGPVTPQLPGSILQFHPNVTVICDMDASASLPL